MRAGSSVCAFILARRRRMNNPAARRWAETGPRARMAMALIIGAATGLGHDPWSLWWVSLIGLAALSMVLGAAPTNRQAAATGWAAGTGYFGLTLLWIVEPFLVDPARHGWMAPFALIGTSAGLGLFWAAGFGFARWLGGRRGAAMALVVTLSLAEMLRSYLLTGFPWALPAYVWTGAAPMHIAALIGPHGLTFLTLLATCGCYGAIAALSRPRGAAMVVAAVWAVFIGLAWGMRPGDPPSPAAPPGPTLRIVQPNAAQHLKWEPTMMPVFFERAVALTAAGGAPDLIIWPETSVPALLGRAEHLIAAMSGAAKGRPLVAGIQRRGESGYHNSLIVIGPGGRTEQIYDKHRLVPFGEYVPLSNQAARFGVSAFAAQSGFGYAPGPGPAMLDFGPELGMALPLICYEAIFPQGVRATPERPRWLLQITNDAWFGRFSGPYQHLAQTRFRAVEQGLPLVRAANTGISAVIDGHGRVRAALPLNEAGHLDAPLPPALPATFYSRTGDAPVWVVLILCAGGMMLVRRQVLIRD